MKSGRVVEQNAIYGFRPIAANERLGEAATQTARQPGAGPISAAANNAFLPSLSLSFLFSAAIFFFLLFLPQTSTGTGSCLCNSKSSARCNAKRRTRFTLKLHEKLQTTSRRSPKEYAVMAEVFNTVKAKINEVLDSNPKLNDPVTKIADKLKMEKPIVVLAAAALPFFLLLLWGNGGLAV